MSNASLLKQLLRDLQADSQAASDMPGAVICHFSNEQVQGRTDITARLSELQITNGWILYPSKTELITSAGSVMPEQPPLEAELVTEDENQQSCTVAIRYLGNNSWRWCTTRIEPVAADADDMTHVASRYSEKLSKGNKGRINYLRLWTWSADKGMYVDHAVLQGISEE